MQNSPLRHYDPEAYQTGPFLSMGRDIWLEMPIYIEWR